MNRTKVLILGAGVSGLTVARTLQRAGCDVTIATIDPIDTTPHTSGNAYAMWVPIGGPRLEKWCLATYDALQHLSRNTQSGVAMRKIISLQMEKKHQPWGVDSMGFRMLSCIRPPRRDEIIKPYVDAHVLDEAPVIDPHIYMPWLRRRVLAGGARFIQQEIRNLQECPREFAFIINCTSLGSRQLVNDADVYCDKMQVVTIKPNGFQHVVIDDGGPNRRACIVPHRNYIKLGAVFSIENDTLNVSDDHTRDILLRCARLMPGYKVNTSDILSVTAALRPERRSGLRVEKEVLPDGRVVIHNYGHDGMGFLLSWGIAEEIAAMVTGASWEA